jgi:hypothetical protein
VDAGADIFSDLSSGKTVTNTAFVVGVMTGSMVGSLYTVDILTGAATEVGDFRLPVTDIAVTLDTN